MKRIILLTIMAMMLFSASQAATLGDLLWKMSQRISEPDSSTAMLSDSAKMVFLDLAQNKVVRLMNYLPNRVDFVFSTDSVKYALPSTFKMIDANGLMFLILDDDGDTLGWEVAFFNPGFKNDTTTQSYFVSWEHQGQAELYLANFVAGDIVRLFYRANAPAMVQRTDSCYVPDDFQGEIIEEAIGYYQQAEDDYAAFQMMYNIVRSDLGISQQRQ